MLRVGEWVEEMGRRIYFDPPHPTNNPPTYPPTYLQGQYCAKIVMEQLNGTSSPFSHPPTHPYHPARHSNRLVLLYPSTHPPTAGPDDFNPKCEYYSSCCFGENHRIIRLPDMETRSDTLEGKCPGARAALSMKCAPISE